MRFDDPVRIQTGALPAATGLVDSYLMTSVQASSVTGSNPPRDRCDGIGSAGRRGRLPGRGTSRHDEALIQAEVRRLARALRPFGLSHNHASEPEATARESAHGGFD